MRSLQGIVARLTTIGFICALALSFTNYSTRLQISDNRANHATEKLLSILHADVDVSIDPLGNNTYQISRNGVTSGHIFEISTTEGYNGEIRLWLAVDLAGTVLGTRVINHQETPGLGDKLDIEVSNWILGFNNQSLDSIIWAVKKDKGDFDQFTGATITPRAVVTAVKLGLIDYKNNRDNWMSSYER